MDNNSGLEVINGILLWFVLNPGINSPWKHFQKVQEHLVWNNFFWLFETFFDETVGQQKHTFSIDIIASDGWHFPGCVAMKMIARCPVRSAECTDSDRIW